MARQKMDVTTLDVCRAIAQQSSLTVSQVRECFKTYYSVIEQIVESPNRPTNYTIPIPYLGKINFIRRYNDPNKKIKGAIKHVDLSNAHLKEEYDQMRMVPITSLKNSVKNISYQRIMKYKEKQNLGNSDGKEN